jgi:hypothetical protein
MENRGVFKNSRTGIKGVCWDPTTNRWRATVKRDGRRVFSARFRSLDAAAEAVRDARRRLQQFSTD